MNTYECLNCKILFKNYAIRGNPRKFCSNECKSDFSKVFIKCEKCQEFFKCNKSSKNRRYCSNKCANSVTMQLKSLNSLKVNFKCKRCDKKITLRECDYKARKRRSIPKYCSINCRVLDKEKKVNCSWCKKEFKPERSIRNFCSKICWCEWRKEKTKLNPGSWIENGYRVLYTENGKGIKEHIKIMQDHIGRELTLDEVVHHINEIRTDNRIENLQLMTRGEHSKLHRIKEVENGKKLF